MKLTRFLLIISIILIFLPVNLCQAESNVTPFVNGKDVSVQDDETIPIKTDDDKSIKERNEKANLGIYFVTPPNSLESPIFGFAQFISALALLVIVFTISGIRYRFRIAVAPIPLFRLTFCLIGVIGFGTLLTDIWFAKQWTMPYFLINQSILQGVFGAIFLLLAMMWIYYAFIKPPKFCKRNYLKFAIELYNIILKGSDSDLPVIADELRRSAEPLVKLSKRIPSNWENDNNEKEEEKKRKPNAGDFAYEILLLIGNRKLCRHIIASSSVTAISLFDAMEDNKKYNLPIGQFARNISTEAITNKDSIIYHEDEGYKSGLLGYHKPFSQAIYGNSRLVDALGSNHGSPFDLDYEIMNSLDALQLKAYSRALIISMKSHLKDYCYDQSSPLHRAFKKIIGCCQDVYKLNDIPSDYHTTDIYKRFDTVVDCIKEAITILCEHRKLPATRLRRYRDRDQWHKDIYDHIAGHMFEIIFLASTVTAPRDKCWGIHYVLVWSGFFGISDDEKARKIIQYKLRRLLYDEILRLGEMPNYKSSRILGICLNVMGFKIEEGEKRFHRNYYSLHKAILAWTINNYLRLKSINPEVAESCLIGSISFDEQSKSLVKTWAKDLDLEAPKDYLKLNEASEINVMKKE